MTFLAKHAPTFAAAGVIVLSMLLGFLARRQVLARLAGLAEKTPWVADTALISSLRRPLPVWFLLGGVYVASHIAPVPREVAGTLERVLQSGLILSITVWVASLATQLLEGRSSGAIGVAATSGTGVVRSVVRIAVHAIGVLVLLSTLGISIGPVLTTMGLGGLAVALGLQSTLSDLFAGMQITLGGTINVGDFVKLESGEEGYVEDIHWRVTRVKTLFDTFVVIPNHRLAGSIVTNYHLPAKGLSFVVPVAVHSSSDLDHVERVTCEVARAVMRAVQGGVPDFDPFIRYRAFGDSSIDFNVILRVREFRASFLVRHAFIKALVRTFASEGIVIPFPVRALNLHQEHAGATRGGTRLTFNGGTGTEDGR